MCIRDSPSSFPRVRSLHVLFPFLIFPTHFFSLPFFSLSLLFIFPIDFLQFMFHLMHYSIHFYTFTLDIFLIYFLLVFNLPTYRITPSAHPVKCPPQCPSPIHRHPPLSSPSTTPSSFPRVRSLYVLSPFLIFPTHFFSLPLYSLSLLFIFPKWMRTYNVCPSPTDLLHSA